MLFKARFKSVINCPGKMPDQRSTVMSFPDQPKNLLEANQEERQRFFDSFDYVLTDCDGTLWNLFGPFVGVSDAINKLKAIGKRVVYVSNNSGRSEKQYDELFQNFNFNANFKDDVIHPGTAIVDYLRSIDFKGQIYVLGTKNLKDFISDNGFDVIQENSLAPIDDTFHGMYDYSTSPLKVSAVVVSFPINQSFKEIVRAQMILTDPECLFIAGATDTILPFPRPMMGPGALLKLLEETTQRKAVVLGKPGLGLRDVVIEKFKITDPKRVLFIGDMPEQDVGFGKTCGFQTLIVLFERTEAELLSITNPNEIADYWLPQFGDILKVLVDLN